MKKNVTIPSPLQLLLPLLLSCGFTCCTTVILEGLNGHLHQQQRSTRSIKDALPKDDEITQARVVLQMRHQISDLESSMKAVNTELDELSEKNSELETSLSKQNVVMEKLEGDMSGLKKLLQSHATTLTDLETLASPDENLFALSNHTCGDVLVAQSGSILFSSYSLRGTRYPWSCVWTIRANNRAFIRVARNYAPRSGYYTSASSTAYVVEVLRSNQTSSTASTAEIETKVTKIERNMHQIFSGPLIFVVCYLTTQSEDYSDYDLHLQYEGMGKLVEKSTFFSHATDNRTSGSFADEQLWPMNTNNPINNGNYTEEFSTIVISNFSTKVHLQSVFPKRQRCGEGDAFVIISDLLGSSSARDCCKTSCDGNSSLVNFDNPFIIMIRKSFGREMSFNLTWSAEKPYPSSSSTVYPGGSAYTYNCGEVLGGGVSGNILYKPHVSYRNGERCIWVISPQPRPRSSIVISIGANGIENTYDHLYMMELTNASGVDLAEPTITRIGRYGMYEAHSREVYIIFYSDSTVTGYGFSLTWRSSGEPVKDLRDVSTRFTILRDDDGQAESVQVKPPFKNDAYQVFLLTPIIPTTYVFGMHLYINQTSPAMSGRDPCLSTDIQVYTALDGMLHKRDISSDCTEPGQLEIENADGMGMIVVKNKAESSAAEPGDDVAMNFSWKQVYGAGNTTYTVIENNECGGIIKAGRGILKYKIGTDYYNNERCVWLLHSPNSTTITLKLQKDGFETCCDYIFVDTIDREKGALKNSSISLNRTNRTHTFEENLLVITFRSDSSTRGRGFALQFSGNGEASSSSSTPSYRYQLRHHTEPFGTIMYPDPEWEDPIPNVEDVLVVAFSLKIGADEDPRLVRTNISWIAGDFHKHQQQQSCEYDSIRFYTATPEPEGWQLSLKYPQENDTLECESDSSTAAAARIQYSKKEDVVSAEYSTFIAIYKPVELQQDATDGDGDNNNDNDMRMGFSFEKAAGCGGVIVGEEGEISYKENGRYSNLEKCVWLIEVPEAKQIRFSVERSGFEDCCDYLSVVAIDGETGLPGSPVIITQSNKSAIVEGSIAVVVFTSDSSVVGEGFLLKFTTYTRISERPSYTASIAHHNQPTDNSFVYKVESNDLVVVAYSPEAFRNFYHTSSKTSIEILSFRPQVDANCNSDKLTIYAVYGRDQGLVEGKVYSSSPTLNHYINGISSLDSCEALQDQDYNPCDNIRDCGDAPEDNSLVSNTTSFIAVYKSVNRTDDELKFRGFVMTSRNNVVPQEDYSSSSRR